jgi:hypothetical protein
MVIDPGKMMACSLAIGYQRAVLDDSRKSKVLKHVWQIFPEHQSGTNPAALFC